VTSNMLTGFNRPQRAFTSNVNFSVSTQKKSFLNQLSNYNLVTKDPGLCSLLTENCAVLYYNTASSGTSTPTFPDNLSFQFSRVTFNSSFLILGPIGCSETSVRKYHYSPCNNPEERSSGLLRGGNLRSQIL
jgi:hypothetical protein